MNPEHLKCPVCIEIFDGKVFILKCGHNLCSTCLPKLYNQSGDNYSYSDDDDDEDDHINGFVKCPVCKIKSNCNKKSDGTIEGLTRNVTIESITQDYREKNGLLTSLDKERKINLLKKGQTMKSELEDMMKFLETAEKLLARKNEILEVQNSITNLLDDFNKNWGNDSPQTLRKRLDILDTELSKKMEHQVFEFFTETSTGTNSTPQNVVEQRNFANWKDSADHHQIIIKDGEQVEQVVKHVGPIWGQHEANAKVRRYMERSGMKNWEWTGSWNSEDGTSYAQFRRKINQ